MDTRKKERQKENNIMLTENIKPEYKVVTVDYFKVIDTAEIAEVNPNDIVFGDKRRLTEEGYKLEVEKMQPWIDQYQKYGNIEAFEKFYYESLILKDRDYERFFCEEIHNAKRSFSHFKCDYFTNNRIEARKTINGQYEVTTNGKHRMYVAKKYGLRLIVHVSEEVRKIE